MKTHHWIGAVVLVIVGVLIGIKYPTIFSNIPGLSSLSGS